MLESFPVASETPTFADITTMGVGGSIETFICPKDRVAFIDAVETADSQGLPISVIGGGSNILAGDDPFPGVVIRDARQQINVLDEASPVEDQDRTVHVSASAGTNWDDFVAYCVRMGLTGVEGLSGIPGTVGASVVQNIGAYGQEVAQSVQSVELWDRKQKTSREFSVQEMSFGYRTSILKTSMYDLTGQPNQCFFPTPRYIVLSVTFALRHSQTGRVDSEQLARALGVETGSQMLTSAIRQAVLSIRAQKGMLEDPYRYQSAWMRGTREDETLQLALEMFENSIVEAGGVSCDRGQNLIADRHSCGSFFMNPVLTPEEADLLPAAAPRYPVAGSPAGAVKTSAAWLIDNAGFHKGFGLPGSSAALSSVHTLSLTNRGGASTQDILDLAETIQKGVREAFDVSIVPEPVLISSRVTM